VAATLEELYRSSHLNAGNAGYIEAYYEAWLEDASAVPDQWREVFESLAPDERHEPGPTAADRAHSEVRERFRALARLNGHTLAAAPAQSHAQDYKQAGVLRLINAYRVRAFLEEARSAENAGYSLLGIAYSCGFNSKATFNRAFRKHTGRSPSEYLREQGAK
jgi:AraC-like DNA-binding protein